MSSSLLPALSRLSLQSSDTVPTAAGPNDPFLVAIVATLTNGSEDEKRDALARLLSDVNGRYSRAGAFVNANGMVPMVALLLTAPVELKVQTAEVLKMLLDTGMLIIERFLNNGGAQALMRGLLVQDNTNLLQWELMLRPFLDLVQPLMPLPHGRARLRSVDAVEVFASVVRKGGLFAADGIANINTRVAMRVIVGLVFDVPLDATTGFTDLTDLDVYELASVLVVDGTRTNGGLSTTHRTMEALVALTSPGGGEKADAVQQALVDAGMLPALLHVLGEGHLEEALLSIMERKALRALTNATTRKPALRFVLAELRTVLGRVRTIGAEQLGPDQSATFNGLGNDVNTYVTTSPLWFVLMDGLKLIVELLRSQAIMARTEDVAKTRLVWALSLCLPVVTWDRELVPNAQTPHPLGDNPRYRELVPVLVPMLHGGSQDGRARMAAKCLELLSNGPVVEAMCTQTIVASLLAFLSDPPASEQEAVNSVMECLNNMLEHDEDTVFWFKTQGGLLAILKHLSSTNDRTVFSAVFMTKLVAEHFELYYDFSGMDTMEDDAQVDDGWVATVAPLVALLEPGRLSPSKTREQVVGCLSALIAPEMPEEAYPIPEGLVATQGAAFSAFVNAGGMERLVPLLRMDEDATSNDRTHTFTVKLLIEIVHNLGLMVVSDATLARAITRFAVAGGIAALVDAGIVANAHANEPTYQGRINLYVPSLQRLERLILAKDSLPTWIKVLLDVTKATKRNVRDLSMALPEARWGHINRIKRDVRHYGQIYELLSQYRAMYKSNPGGFANPDVAINVFEWMDDSNMLLRAALRRVPSISVIGKVTNVENYAPSLLAAELWVVHTLAEVLTTNVSFPVDPEIPFLTNAQRDQVAHYRDLLRGAQQLQIQYAWAVAHPNAPANFVETYRTELRINELLTMLVEKIETPLHVDGSRTVMHRDEIAKLVDQGLVEDSEDDGGDSRKRARTSAALHASITMLYGAAHTDATMTRLFPHL